MRKLWKKFSEYDRIANISEIGRRYFAMNSFDGILTILGILIGSYVAGIREPKIIISTGIAASIAMGVSGMWGTYLTEEAERKKKLKDLGKQTLRDMYKTKLGKAEHTAAIIVSFIDGIAPFISSMMVIIPFFFSGLFAVQTMYIVSMIMVFVLLGLLGAFLGHISRENLLISGLKMVVAGVVCTGLILLLGA